MSTDLWCDVQTARISCIEKSVLWKIADTAGGYDGYEFREPNPVYLANTVGLSAERVKTVLSKCYEMGVFYPGVDGWRMNLKVAENLFPAPEIGPLQEYDGEGDIESG